MNCDIFSYDYSGRFVTFSAMHIITLIIVAVVIIATVLIMRRVKDEKSRKIFRYCLAIVLFLAEGIRMLWLAIGGRFTLAESLPIHICGIMIITCIILLLSKNQTFFEICFYLGISGPIQALITPDAKFPFPHFMYFQTFIAHGGILLTVFYFIFVEKFRPKNVFALIKVAIITNLYMILILGLNYLLNSNYLFLMGPLDNPTLVDIFVQIFGRPPLHIIGLELMGVISFAFLHLFWSFYDLLKAEKGRKGRFVLEIIALVLAIVISIGTFMIGYNISETKIGPVKNMKSDYFDPETSVDNVFDTIAVNGVKWSILEQKEDSYTVEASWITQWKDSGEFTRNKAHFLVTTDKGTQTITPKSIELGDKSKDMLPNITTILEEYKERIQNPNQ